jgi:uncharacterized protein YukE
MAEVYEKYSIALARILDMLRQCSDMVRESDKDVESHFAEIIADITVIGEHIRHTEDILRSDARAILDKMNELYVAVAKAEQRLAGAEHNTKELKEAVEALRTDLSSVANSTHAAVQQLVAQQNNVTEFWRRWKFWLLALLSFVGIVETLLQLGVIDIVWFKPK